MQNTEVNFNFRQITLAREYRGYSQSELASAIIGLSQPNLSKFEKGLGGLSQEILNKIADFLGFPESFFGQKISSVSDFAHFRKRATISKKKKLSFDSNIKLIGYLIDKMSESLDWPDYMFPSFDIEDGFSPEYIASFIRNKLKIKSMDPVLDIMGKLENNGIIIVEFNPKDESFDGVSFLTDLGTPVIILNKSFSNDRKRFTLSHELGHLIMHITGNQPLSDFRDIEDEANKFAAEFLMPKNEIFNSLVNLKVSYLGELKKYWLSSMASILYRAKSIDAIDKERYIYLNIELSRRGWRKKEPFDVEIDKARLFETGLEMHRNELGYSESDFEYGFSLPIDIINSYSSQGHNSTKLRVIV